MVLSFGQKVVELYHLQDFGHNDGALVAYLPNEKILVEADAFNPPAQPLTQAPAAVNPFTASLVDNIARLKLDVETIIPVHYPADNRKITAAELLIAAGKPNSSAHTKPEAPTKTRSGNS
jgi:glyoxylase-like metal-dependent hydrolase (beta-lactamase superfamily II)